MVEGSVVIEMFLSRDGIYLAGLVRTTPSGATKIASRLAGSVLLAFSLTRWVLPGGSKKVSPALYIRAGPVAEFSERMAPVST
jgi:hypothetical protein